MTERRACILLVGGGTGGHVFPMIAVADALRSLQPGLELFFVGTSRGIETRVVPSRGYELELVDVLPIRGGGVAGALRGVRRAAASIPEALTLLERRAPRAVFSLGGYAAGPISVAARLKRMPLALMEPNAAIGLSNRLVAAFAQRAYTAFPEVERHFSEKVVLRSGVPIRAGFSPRPYPKPRGVLRVLVLGGSQGARALNQVLPEALGKAQTSVRVIHQTGAADEASVREHYRALGAGERVSVISFIDDMPGALGAADLVIGRSGASAVAEICAVGRPSLLVPYPHAAADHQRLNAESLAADGAASCISAPEATAERIAFEIDRLAGTPELLERMAEAAKRRGRPDAALEIARDLLQLAGLDAASSSDKPPTPRSGSVTGQKASGVVISQSVRVGGQA